MIIDQGIHQTSFRPNDMTIAPILVIHSESSMEDIEYHPNHSLNKKLVQELSTGTY